MAAVHTPASRAVEAVDVLVAALKMPVGDVLERLLGHGGLQLMERATPMPRLRGGGDTWFNLYIFPIILCLIGCAYRINILMHR